MTYHFFSKATLKERCAVVNWMLREGKSYFNDALEEWIPAKIFTHFQHQILLQCICYDGEWTEEYADAFYTVLKRLVNNFQFHWFVEWVEKNEQNAKWKAILDYQPEVIVVAAAAPSSTVENETSPPILDVPIIVVDSPLYTSPSSSSPSPPPSPLTSSDFCFFGGCNRRHKGPCRADEPSDVKDNDCKKMINGKRPASERVEAVTIKEYVDEQPTKLVRRETTDTRVASQYQCIICKSEECGKRGGDQCNACHQSICDQCLATKVMYYGCMAAKITFCCPTCWEKLPDFLRYCQNDMCDCDNASEDKQSLRKALNYCLPFGCHEDLTIGEVLRIHPSYLRWLTGKMNPEKASDKFVLQFGQEAVRMAKEVLKSVDMNPFIDVKNQQKIETFFAVKNKT